MFVQGHQRVVLAAAVAAMHPASPLRTARKLVQRKYFHIVAAALFIPVAPSTMASHSHPQAAIVDVDFLAVGMAGAAAVLVGLEVVRVARLPVLADLRSY